MSHDICMCETSIIHFVLMVSEQVNNTIATVCCICLHAAFQIVVHGLEQVNNTFVRSFVVLLSSASACPHCTHGARGSKPGTPVSKLVPGLPLWMAPKTQPRAKTASGAHSDVVNRIRDKRAEAVQAVKSLRAELRKDGDSRQHTCALGGTC